MNMSSMAGPAWVPDLFASLMLLVAAYSAGHLWLAYRLGRRTHVDIDVMHMVMGVGMAGMLAPDLSAIGAGPGELIFGAMAAVFAWHCYRFVAERGAAARDEDRVHHLSHYATHLVMAVAMIYMYAAGNPSASTADFVGLPVVFIAVLIVSGIWELDGTGRLACVPRGASQVPGPALAGVGSGAEVGPSTHDGTDAAQAARVDRLRQAPAAAPEPSGAESRAAEAAPGRPTAGWLTPGLESAAHVVMCVTMAYMLVLAL